LATPPGIFISYRREDTSGHAGRLYDRLSTRFGASRIFMDVDTLQPGVDFVDVINQAIGSAGVLLAVIGRSWVRIQDQQGQRRLDDPNDFVRREIEGALVSDKRVIPVLVQGAPMPSEGQLPEPLRPLSRRSALELRDTDYQGGVEKLVRVLEPLLEPHRPSEPKREPQRQALTSPRATAITALAGSALLGIGLILLRSHFLDHRFPGTIVPSGLLQGPAPIAVLAGCILTALAIWAKGRRAGWLALGLLLGFGAAAVVKGLSLLGESQASVTAGGLLWIVGGFIVIAGGVVSLVPLRPPQKPAHYPVGTSLVLLAAATMLIVGAAIPFTIIDGEEKVIVTHNLWGADPIGTAIAVVIAVVLLNAGMRPLAAGMLIALGIASALLWIRYVGVPILQWVDKDPPDAKVQAGGIIGGAGAVLVLLTGWGLARRTEDVAVPTAGETPLPAS
jgi:hypothetical protein